MLCKLTYQIKFHFSVDTTKHSNSSFICNHTNKARQEDMHLSNEIDQDTSLGAIQKNNLPNSVDMMSNTGTNPRRFGENVSSSYK